MNAWMDEKRQMGQALTLFIIWGNWKCSPFSINMTSSTRYDEEIILKPGGWNSTNNSSNCLLRKEFAFCAFSPVPTFLHCKTRFEKQLICKHAHNVSIRTEPCARQRAKNSTDQNINQPFTLLIQLWSRNTEQKNLNFTIPTQSFQEESYCQFSFRDFSNKPLLVFNAVCHRRPSSVRRTWLVLPAITLLLLLPSISVATSNVLCKSVSQHFYWSRASVTCTIS